ncbi:lactonase family protein [Streptococcus iniae]|uniref:lactonase family protein n=1 Tax=Streptococcus iniae TaxID=1346 RepID=UPI000EF6AEDC|nr:lactonase family protein [Streptococcus iniae]RLU42324.1 lactonase family protein [Streptococcus iniae]RLU48589.1 lactonase family protein [Streptococcus iniae]RMI58075.1 lactonase family protein [Streptococcus iniae]RMI59215.1 lactonase family protein [Streptococcus iniae]RMI62793.1 lactonase family protein [Streptococcus iniae]
MQTKIYFGTYTKEKSKGIYQVYLDETNGQFTDFKKIITLQNPTYLSKTDDFLFSLIQDGDKAGLASFNTRNDLISSALIEGPAPCHIAVDCQRQLAFGANYHKGEITLYHFNQLGKLSLTDCFQLSHPNQGQSRAHFVGLSPDKYLVTCDLGADAVTTFKLVDNNSHLEKITHYQAQAGAGCRQLVFHPNEKIAYLLYELNSTVEVLIYNGYGYFELLQTVSTLPDSYADFNACAAIRISADGRFLYCSNRGHDSITLFKIRRDGQLEVLDYVASAGQTPRDFNISPSQNYLIVAHQESNTISLFKRDQDSGKLNLLSNTLEVPEPTCVLFD